jgi:Uma2 family endonuclease
VPQGGATIPAMNAVEKLRPRRHRFTVDDYYRLAEAGALPPDARVELIEGEIIDMAPMGSRHASSVSMLDYLLKHAAGDRALVRVRLPVRLDETSEPHPDVALVKPRTNHYRASHPTPADTLLVIEVSDSTLRDDLDVKAPLYAAHGVPEVWVLDVEAGELHVFRALVAGKYTDVSVLKQPGMLAPEGRPDLQIDLSELFRL